MAAIKAVKVGVAGIVVSNHGGRQLDYAPATITVLEEVGLYLYCLAKERLSLLSTQLVCWCVRHGYWVLVADTLHLSAFIYI